MLPPSRFDGAEGVAAPCPRSFRARHREAKVMSVDANALGIHQELESTRYKNDRPSPDEVQWNSTSPDELQHVRRRDNSRRSKCLTLVLDIEGRIHHRVLRGELQSDVVPVLLLGP